MANGALFEDLPEIIETIEDTLLGSEHHIIEQETTVAGAFNVLKRVLDGEVSLDYILLDGRLDPDIPPAEFLRPPVGRPLREVPPRKGWLLKKEVALPEPPPPPPIMVNKDFIGAQHARAILEVMDVWGITIPVIGISSSLLAEQVDEVSNPDQPYAKLVTIDLTKSRLDQLPTAIDSLQRPQATTHFEHYHAS